jgi:hypothetical protein
MTLRQKTFALRTGVLAAGLLALTLCFSPTLLLASDAKVTAPVATAPAAVKPTDATVAPAPVTTPTTTAVPAPVPAPKEQAWWQAMLLPVLSIIGMFIAAFLAAGLRKVVQLVEKKWSIEIPDAIEKMMYDKAKWAVGWAEEQAEKRLLYGDGKKTPGAEKLTQVVSLLETFAKSFGYSEEWQRNKIEQLAEGVLHVERGVTVGSDGARGTALLAKTVG